MEESAQMDEPADLTRMKGVSWPMHEAHVRPAIPALQAMPVSAMPGTGPVSWPEHEFKPSMLPALRAVPPMPAMSALSTQSISAATSQPALSTPAPVPPSLSSAPAPPSLSSAPAPPSLSSAPAPPSLTAGLVTLMRCSLCKCAVLVEEMRQHTADHFSFTGENNFTCEECGESFSDRTVYSRHKYRHKIELAQGTGPFTCDTCGNEYISTQGLKQHIKLKHSSSEAEERVSCEICGKSYQSLWSYRKHKRKFHGEGILEEHKCRVCEEEFTANRKLKEHEFHSHGLGKKFDCIKCSMPFYTQYSYKRHLPICGKEKVEKSYECQTCGKLEPTMWKLRIHESVHTGEKNFNCELCGKAFSHPGSVINHKKSAHRDQLNRVLP